MGLFRRVARARLARRVIRRLRRAGVRGARYHRAGFEVRFTLPGEPEPTILPLAALAGRKRREVRDHVAGILRTADLPLRWADAAPLLRPVLRGGAPGAPLHRPALPFLSEFVVVDHPDTMTYVSPAQLAAWEVTAEAVFATARANLPGASLHGAPSGRPVVVRFVDDGNAYWTSHLLLPGWLSRLSGQVGGVPVAFAPERGTLLVTADGTELLPALFAQAEEIFARSSRSLTPMAYVSDPDGCTVPYPAPPGHPLHAVVARAERILAVEEYSRQAAGLPGAAEIELAGERTRALWPRNTPVLLPTADEVRLGDRVVPWADLALTPVEGLSPARWRAEGWPEGAG
ncbi:hypothetical protein ACWT_1267 [Actinoplanes sp. SE50]|uniref:hypothetical protein n=1 Tax=unclassified Actinoplanes TaxID=2626549 RepID=UPI00023EBAFF|nr:MULTISPECIES: hypothetical protein [unclassified Actinoplanes]AEV82285.1 hypothetical protein ACPL_1388 [Actinoplanes sp. SE50/110]ATO80682.1 hypothetical protein ACWT_1267 [Actinoplanes sp. SE50]SLL98089.1 hypothetical protein ACSP50_1311 [Actinoplanes sp. SE50/110]